MKHTIAAIVENKIDSAEHGEQLRRYRETAEREYRDHRRLFIYLTPGGDEPSDELYLPLDYDRVATLVARTASRTGLHAAGTSYA